MRGAVLADIGITRPFDGEAHDLGTAIDTGKIAEELHGLTCEVYGAGEHRSRGSVEAVFGRASMAAIGTKHAPRIRRGCGGAQIYRGSAVDADARSAGQVERDP